MESVSLKETLNYTNIPIETSPLLSKNRYWYSEFVSNIHVYEAPSCSSAQKLNCSRLRRQVTIVTLNTVKEAPEQHLRSRLVDSFSNLTWSTRYEISISYFDTPAICITHFIQVKV